MSLLNRQILFVHINKSCGGVITNNFKKNGINEIINYHRSLNDMLNIAKIRYNINKESLTMFTIVRNPWERMLSMYLYYHKNKMMYPEFFSGNETIDNDFNNWIEFIYSSDFDRDRIHSAINMYKYCFSNQLNWVKDHHGNVIKGVHIFKVEETDIEDLLKNQLGLQNVDAKTRVHPTSHDHYSKYYNSKSKELVAQHYNDDIITFKYSFTNS